MRIPHTGTPAIRDFLESWARLNDLLFLILDVVWNIDTIGGRVNQFLQQVAQVVKSQKQRERFRTGWPEGGRPFTERLTRNRHTFLEMMISRHVDSYLNYVSSLLFEIFIQRPETLRSARSPIDVEMALSHQSIKGLVRAIAEKRVDSLSYSSFTDLRVYFDKNFGITLVQPQALRRIVETIEIRNISVHNRSIVDERYVARTGTARSEIGKKKRVYLNHVLDLTPVLAAEAVRVDRSARKELKLKGVRFDISALVQKDDGPPGRSA